MKDLNRLIIRPDFTKEGIQHLEAPGGGGESEWHRHVLSNIMLQRTNERMLLWKEIYFQICRLRRYGFPKDGVRAGKAMAKNHQMSKAWWQLFGLIHILILSVTWDLQDAYAWSEGSELVVREPVSIFALERRSVKR